MIRALVIDDERLARGELRRLLAPHGDIDVVGEAADGESALQAIRERAPHLLFLDVQMPGASGFDLLARLDHVPEVIFTTAYDRYGLQAFEVNALDYLQKPIQAERLARALERARERIAREPARPAAPERIFIQDGARCWFVRLGEIVLFESEGNYTRVHFGGQRPLLLRSLNRLEERLDAQRFFRANRRQIVNLDYTRKVEAVADEGLVMTLEGGLRVTFSRRRGAEFRSRSRL